MFNSLLKSLVDTFICQSVSTDIPINECFNDDAYLFVKKELSLTPIFFRLPIFMLLLFFLIYAYVRSGFHFFSSLPFNRRVQLLNRWECMWTPGFTLLRLLRSLTYLSFYDARD